ncbi:D-alanyl-D-alanine carboxypeptidase/D-alanyl-D-alanine-endopeptidase [Nocardioides sp. SYSU D00038]|uniref:D-alanyl-D-alanine carboxypeptidase/D-alanyl-D-alanine endopeptidase n=1 Tax=Nocardioides sp. SYSU D00038 TaxID=2812554 RepID=UPI00196888F7|nr:D-alanyl-D-alanine carboxypeptidase/D-alanyl-D-alanine-endopeptidase [Nocardioides sp. SYSU D00038]
MPRRDRSHDDRGLVGRLVALVVVLALSAAGVAAWRLDLVVPWYEHLTGDDREPVSPAAVAPPPGLDLPVLPAGAPVAAPADGPGLAPAKVRRALAPHLADPRLGPHVLATVVDLETGEVVHDRGSGAAVPASTTKVVTAVAALVALGPEHRFTTRVVAGGGNRVVLVGGGDPLLGSAPPDGETAYPAERADVETLAQQTAVSLRERGRTRVRVGYDDSLFAGPSFNPAWPPTYRGDVVAPVTALWVDEGRPAEGYGRVEDPSLVAATAFAGALSRAGIEVVGEPQRGVAGAGGAELASLASPPVREIVERVLLVSDNEAAEVLAHHVGLARGQEGSFEGGAAATEAVLAELGVPQQGLRLRDGSGLSRENRISPEALVAALAAATAPDRPALHSVLGSLPVAGFTGSLAYRFDEGDPAGRGSVRAKTGTLTNVRSLAGVGTDRDGTPYLFVLMADRIRKKDDDYAQRVLDRAAGALGACRCSVAPSAG